MKIEKYSKEKEEEIFLEELLRKSFEKEEKPFDEDKLFEKEEFEQEENFEQVENSVFEKALLDFAKAIGKEPEELSEILKKGEEFEIIGLDLDMYRF